MYDLSKFERWQSLPQMFFEQASRRHDKPFLWAKQAGAYRPLTWDQAAARVRALAGGLVHLGVQPGDRVSLISENRPDWAIAHFAIMAVGAITVPHYVTHTTLDHRHVLIDAGSVGALVSKAALAKRVEPAMAEAPDCRFLLELDGAPDAPANRELATWAQVEALGGDQQAEVERRLAALTRKDTALFIYTSGTGGVPKGVVLSHGNILANCLGACDLLAAFTLVDERFLSFLPLSHSYEHAAGLCFPISIGAEIFYAEGAETLLTNLAEAKPTIMTAVPRLYEMLNLRIRQGAEKKGGLSLKLFNAALATGLKRNSGKPLSLREKALDCLTEKLVRKKVRQRFGGRLKAFVSGGAALNPDVGSFLQAIGLTLLQGYGQTEASPIVSCNRPDKVKMASVGPPLKGVTVKIAEDGEILVAGELVMQGYWKDPEGTARAVKDGWLHTGDVGHLDADGAIFITDRKKDILVLSGGDNVSPARVEGILTLAPEIEQAMVYGDKRPNLVALVVPRATWLKDWAAAKGKPNDLAQLCNDPALHEAISAAIDRVNKNLSVIEKLRRFIIASAPFTIDNEMMTPTMKIRRHKIKALYGERLDQLYGKG